MTLDVKLKKIREEVLDLRLSDLLNPAVLNELAELREALSDIINMVKPSKRPIVWNRNDNKE